VSDTEQVTVGHRVHWLELLFDLVMVAYIGQVAHTMHGDPSWLDLLEFVALLAIAWWAWINASLTMSLFGARVTPAIWVAVSIAMVALGFMAAAVPEAFGERAAAFALGNAAIRLVWMLPWLARRRETGTPWWRPVAYSVLPAALWVVSIAVPTPWRYLLWAAAVAVELVLLIGLGGTGRWSRRSFGDQGSWVGRAIDVDHVVERVSLLVVIVFGESVLSVITELSEHWAAETWITAALGLFAVATLAWIFFTYATGAVERGLRRLQRSGSVGGLRDTVMYLPFLLIAGVVLFAAGIGTAVADAAEHLPVSAALCVAGGVGLFFLASALESLRYGMTPRDIALIAPAGIVLPWLLVPLAVVASAGWVVAATAVLLGVLALLNAANARRLAARTA
jgi:low temperature requirement protein LtrA